MLGGICSGKVGTIRCCELAMHISSESMPSHNLTLTENKLFCTREVINFHTCRELRWACSFPYVTKSLAITLHHILDSSKHIIGAIRESQTF